MNIGTCRNGDNRGYQYNADRNGTTFHGKQGERIKQTAEKKGSQYIESTIIVVGAGNAPVGQIGEELDLLDAGVTDTAFIRTVHMPPRPIASEQDGARRCHHGLPDAKVTDSPTRPHAAEGGGANGTGRTTPEGRSAPTACSDRWSALNLVFQPTYY